MIELNSTEQLRVWLHGKKPQWSHIIAVRAAMRCIPVALRGYANLGHPEKHFLALFRTAFLAWSSIAYEAEHIAKSVAGASNRLISSLDSEKFGQKAVTDKIEKIISELFYASQAIARAGRCACSEIDSDILAADAVSDVLRCGIDEKEVWRDISTDCEWLSNFIDVDNAAKSLSWKSLRQGDYAYSSRFGPSLFHERIDANFSIWLDWFRNRENGSVFALDFDNSLQIKDDVNIAFRISDQNNREFWDRGAFFVNSEIQRWMGEIARELADSVDAALAEAPTQDSTAITYSVNAEGKVDRLPISNQHVITHPLAKGDGL